MTDKGKRPALVKSKLKTFPQRSDRSLIFLMGTALRYSMPRALRAESQRRTRTSCKSKNKTRPAQVVPLKQLHGSSRFHRRLLIKCCARFTVSRFTAGGERGCNKFCLRARFTRHLSARDEHFSLRQTYSWPRPNASENLANHRWRFGSVVDG